MILSAVAVLIFLSALAVGINDAMIRNSVSLYTGHIAASGIPLSLNQKQLEVTGVSAVLQRFYENGIILSNEGATMATIIGIDPRAEKETTSLWKKTVAGSYPAPHDNALLVSRSVAEQLKVTPAASVRFKQDIAAMETASTIAGIYETGVTQLDQNMVFCPIDLFTKRPEVWSAAVFLQEGVSPHSVIEKYASRQSTSGIQFKTWEDLMPDLRELIDLNYASMSIVIVLVFGIVALGISCAFMIFIIKNLREYGIMKAMGVTPGETSFLISAEVLLMSVVASCAGMLVGIVSVFLVRRMGIDLTGFTSHNRYFAVSGIIYPRLTAFSIWIPPAVALVSSLGAALWPAAVVARKKAAEILRGV